MYEIIKVKDGIEEVVEIADDCKKADELRREGYFVYVCDYMTQRLVLA